MVIVLNHDSDPLYDCSSPEKKIKNKSVFSSIIFSFFLKQSINSKRPPHPELLSTAPQHFSKKKKNNKNKKKKMIFFFFLNLVHFLKLHRNVHQKRKFFQDRLNF